MKKQIALILFSGLIITTLHSQDTAKGFDGTSYTGLNNPIDMGASSGPKGFATTSSATGEFNYYPWFSKPLEKTEHDKDITKLSKLNNDPPKKIEIPKVITRGASLYEMIKEDDVDGVKEYVLNNPGSSVNQDAEGFSALHIAADAGAINVATYLIEEEKSPLNVVSDEGHLPIDRLALAKTLTYDQARMLKLFILNRSKKPSVTDKYDYLYFVWPGDNYRTRFSFSQTPLHLASDRGQIGLVRLFLESGANVTDINRGGKIPLHLAVRSGSFESVKLLIENGSDVNTKDSNDNLPINEAFFLKKDIAKNMVKFLVENGSDVNTANVYNNTPLILCAVWNLDSSIAKILIEGGADINFVNDIGNTALHESILRDNKELATFLTELDEIDISIRNNKNDTPLSILMKGDVEKIKWFADKLDPNISDDEGNTPLHLAAELGSSKEIVDFFIEKGAGVDLKNDDGNSPLMVALERKNKETSLALIKNKAGLYEKNKRGNVIMYKLLEHANTDFIEKMFDFYSEGELPVDADGNGPLNYAIETNKLDMVEFIAQKYPSEIDKTNDKDETVLHIASKNSNDKVVNILANLTKNLDKKDRNDETALHVAIRSASLESAKNLIDAGANVNIANMQDQVPIVLAMEMGNEEIFNALSKAKDIDLGVKNRLGDTPLHAAVRLNNQYAVETLVKIGADTSIKNKEGSNPKELATQIGVESLVAIL